MARVDVSLISQIFESLTDKEAAFLAEYYGQKKKNATEAYKALNPRASTPTAFVHGVQTLRNIEGKFLLGVGLELSGLGMNRVLDRLTELMKSSNEMVALGAIKETLRLHMVSIGLGSADKALQEDEVNGRMSWERAMRAEPADVVEVNEVSQALPVPE